MPKYNYIAYFGKNEVIVNEQEKPSCEGMFIKDLAGFKDALSEWQSSCKTIPIANGHEGRFLNHCVNLTGKMEFDKELESGILLTNDVIRFESRPKGVKAQLGSGLHEVYYHEVAYFIEPENETQEDIIQDFMRKITGMTLPTEQLSEAKKLFTITRK